MVLPFAFIFLTLSFVLKYRRYDNHVATKILKDYQNKNYENKQISLKFYEDKVEYSFGEIKEEIQYSSFKKFYEGPAYFALYFHTGDLILMSDKQNVAKIKGIIDGYKANLAKKAAEAEA